MKKKAIFPGTFDPFTIGHLSIVERSLGFFDEIVIAIGNNISKKTFFPMEKRIEMVEKIFEYQPRVSVMGYESLTADFAKKINADVILRGIRTVADFEYERTIADANQHLTGIETFLLFTETRYSFISSSVVRELLTYEKDVSRYVPKNIDINKYL